MAKLFLCLCLFLAFLAPVHCLSLRAAASLEVGQQNYPQSTQTLDELWQHYAVALQDAKVALPSEISDDLTAITPDNEDLVWDDTGRVLMVTWTSYPGYDNQVGKETTIGRETWVTAVPELRNFCRDFHPTPEEPLTLRLEQLLGLPPMVGKTRFVEVWVEPEDIFRPTPDDQITDTVAQLTVPPRSAFDSEEDYEFARDWYNSQLAGQHYDDPAKGYPWTRLGYTYDWCNSDSEVGLSEFVIKAKSSAKVERVSTTEDYCQVALSIRL